ncbi:hypothetical protein ES708_29226 [subsurface metagenome]
MIFTLTVKSLWRLPSLTLTIKLVFVILFASGVKSTALLFPVPDSDAVPCEGSVKILHVILSPSASLAFSVKAKAVGSSSSEMDTVVSDPSVNTGALL